MPRAVKISRAAAADLRAIARYTQHLWGANQRYEYLALLEGHFEILAENPRVGRLRDEDKSGLFSSVAGRHVIFYRADDTAIRIVRVLHQSMDHRRWLK
jgi:toxin ParE1/3/4